VIGIFRDFFKQRKRSFTKKGKNKGSLPKKGLNAIKKQLGEHLKDINENTNEIQSNYEFLSAIENKIDKLTERVDQMQFFLQCNSNFIADKTESFEIRPLTRKEQYVFLVLYALDDEKNAISYADIAKKTGFPESLVRDYLTSIIAKGVPITKRYINNKAYLKLNKEFKRLQAKENILCIDTAQKELINF